MLLFEQSDEDGDEFIDFGFEGSQTQRRKDLVCFEALEPVMGFVRFSEAVPQF